MRAGGTGYVPERCVRHGQNSGGSCVSFTGTMRERRSAGRRVQGQPEDEG